MFLASFHDGSSLGNRMACLATPKLIRTTSMMITKYIMSIIWKSKAGGKNNVRAVSERVWVSVCGDAGTGGHL